MNLMNAHVLGTAVINVTANTRGVDYALAETRRQMNGFLTFANAFGGKFGGAIGSLWGTVGPGGGLQSVANAINNARIQHAFSMQQWQGQRPDARNFQGVNGGPFQWGPYIQAMSQWRTQRPNLAQMQQQAVQGAATGAGQSALLIAGVVGGLELLARGLKGAAEAASDYVEAVAKSEQVFGSHKGVIGAQAASLASKYGVSRRETHALSSSAGLLLQGSGVDEKSSAEMGANLAKLAAEASSFYNVPVEEAMRKIQSGLSGMARPLREFGVLITESKVKAKAFEMGLVGADGAISDGAKTLARYALITEGLARAEGDIARSQDRYSMQVRMLQGNWENLSESIGEVVLPALTSLVEGLNWVIQTTEKAVKAISMIPGPSTIGDYLGSAVFGAAPMTDEQWAAAAGGENLEDIDARNKAMIDEQVKLNAEEAMSKKGGRHGAGYTDLEGLNKQIQESISGGKDAILRDQVEIAKKSLEEQKKMAKAIQGMAKNKPGMPGGIPF